MQATRFSTFTEGFAASSSFVSVPDSAAASCVLLIKRSFFWHFGLLHVCVSFPSVTSTPTRQPQHGHVTQSISNTCFRGSNVFTMTNRVHGYVGAIQIRGDTSSFGKKNVISATQFEHHPYSSAFVCFKAAHVGCGIGPRFRREHAPRRIYLITTPTTSDNTPRPIVEEQ